MLSLRFIVIVFVIVVLGIGYYILDSKTSVPSPSPSPSASTSSLKPSEMKTYTNSKYSFSINYPENWTYREYPDTGDGAGFRPSSEPNDPQYEYITISRMPKVLSIKAVSFEEYVKTAGTQEIQNYKSINTNEKIVTDAGVIGYNTTWNYQPLGGGGTEISLPRAYFPSIDNGATIQVSLNDENYLDTYNQMIKTFSLK